MLGIPVGVRTEVDLTLFGGTDQSLPGTMIPSGIGRKTNVLFLNFGIHFELQQDKADHMRRLIASLVFDA